MTLTTISSRAFNQDTSGAKRAATDGPVFITDRGSPAHVLLTIEAYWRLTSVGANLVEQIAMPDGADIEFDPQPLQGPLARAADLS